MRILVAIVLLLGYLSPAQAVNNNSWGFCDENGAGYYDVELKKRRLSIDWLCKLPTGASLNLDVVGGTERCKVAGNAECSLKYGGNETRAPWGDHNVPRAGWYLVNGLTEIPHIRCQCGCFSEDVNILTTTGNRAIGEISKMASYSNLRVATFSETGDMVASEKIENKDFTIGPEEKMMYRLTTSDEKSVQLTENHPVLILEEGRKKMVQAKSLEEGSILLTFENEEVSLDTIETFYLEADENKVYNFDSKGKTDEEHVIVANGLMMGDIYWQKKISEKSSRMANLLNW